MITGDMAIAIFFALGGFFVMLFLYMQIKALKASERENREICNKIVPLLVRMKSKYLTDKDGVVDPEQKDEAEALDVAIIAIQKVFFH